MFHHLKIVRWAGLCVDGEGEEAFGEAAGADSVAPGVWRRIGRLERLAVRCAIGVLRGEPASELIFCSRYGNLETLVAMLRGIAEEQPISPMAFSGSVHNAAPGLIGQILKERLAHTALAAGRNTLAAGLTEAYARLAADDCADVTLIYADLPLPEVYSGFDEENAPGVALAMRLQLANPNEPAIAIRPGRNGALNVLGAMKEGPLNLALEDVAWAGSIQ